MPAAEERLEQALRHAVQVVYKIGDLEELTVKRMRKAAEESLHLYEGFFKESEEWKDRSKRIIEEEAEALSSPATNEPLAPLQPKSPEVTPKESTKALRPPINLPKKRASSTELKTKKRRKIVKTAKLEDKPSDHHSLGTVDNTSQTVPHKPSTHGAPMHPPDLDSSDVAKDQRDADNQRVSPDNLPAPVGPVSESEMSDVIDDGPKPPRKRRSGSGEAKTKVAKKQKDKQKTAKPQETDPDADDIKRLQGWLIKCGIRKMWYRELAPFETPKAKIRHLKEMLADAGLTGRYSADKAAEIRETRELQADLEAVQAGAKQWGKAKSDDEPDTQPRRRLAKSLQSLDFLNDEDGEETD